MAMIPLWALLDEDKVLTGQGKDQLWNSPEYSLQTLTHLREGNERSTRAVGLRSHKDLAPFACLTLTRTNRLHR